MSEYRYTRNDPHWVEAESVVAAVPNGSYVNVTAYGVEYKMRRVEWSNPWFDKTKSDVLVQTSEGDWLRVWFKDADVKPFVAKPSTDNIEDDPLIGDLFKDKNE